MGKLFANTYIEYLTHSQMLYTNKYLFELNNIK